ncbi:MAG: prohibitin family protein [Anaerolineaceae bacterium]|nr:prohibitin family protein [Anaerolineaceae bacterium]
MNIARLFQAVSLFAWVGFFLVVAVVVMQASRKTPVKRAGTLILVVAVVAIVISTVSAGLVFIEPQERGVVISAIDPKGYREQALDPGLHWVIPFAESVITYPISRQTYTMSIAPTEGQLAGDDSIEARTSDGQKVLIDASIIYAVDPTQVVKVHITWQDRYDRDLVRAQARGVIRDAVSQFGIEEVYSSKRFELVDMVSKELTNKFDENGLIMIDFVLRNISFSDEYAASVEQKQIAEQLAQQGKFVVEQKKQEAEQARQTAQGRADAAVIDAQGRADARLIEAEAEAKALELVAAAIKDNPDLLM